MTLLDEEVESMADMHVRVGQREHRLIDLGIRDPEQPTADPSWWELHYAEHSECCGPVSIHSGSEEDR